MIAFATGYVQYPAASRYFKMLDYPMDEVIGFLFGPLKIKFMIERRIKPVFIPFLFRHAVFF